MLLFNRYLQFTIKGSEFVFYAFDAVVDGGFRDAERQAHLARRDTVEVEKQEGFVGWREAVDEFVEPFDEVVLALFGEVVVGVVVEREDFVSSIKALLLY